MTCNHSQEGIYIACVYCDIEHATITERERIIALLEDNQWRDEVVFNFVIALIKGEN